MSEKFRKIVNASHKAIGHVREKIQDTSVLDVYQGAAKGTKKLANGVKQFLFWVPPYQPLDNNVLKQKQDRPISTKIEKKQKIENNVLNKRSNLKYFLLASIIVGGGLLFQNKGSDKEKEEPETDIKKVVVVKEKKTLDVVIPKKLKDFTGKNVQVKNVTEKQQDFIKKFLENHWNEIVIAVTELETFRAVPVVHSGESRPTAGPGLTYKYYYDKDGVLCRTVYGKVRQELSKQEMYEQLKMHLVFETLPWLYGITEDKKLTDRQMVAIIMAGYQMPGHMKSIVNKLQSAKTEQEVADAFLVNLDSMSSKFRDGTRKRRWWCAAYATGRMTEYDFLDLKCDGFSNVKTKDNMFFQNGHFIMADSVIAYAKDCVDKVQKEKVVDFLADFQIGRDVLAVTNGDAYFKLRAYGNEIDYLQAQEEYYQNSCAKALALIKDKKYAKARDMYLDLIDQFPKHIGLQNDLAFVYNEMGRYQDAIKLSRKVIFSKGATKGEIAAANYNAGVAYEKQGNLERALANYKLAAEKGGTTVAKNAVERLEKQIADNQVAEKQGAEKQKKTAFNQGIQNIRKKNARSDLLLYGTVKSVENNA